MKRQKTAKEILMELLGILLMAVPTDLANMRAHTVNSIFILDGEHPTSDHSLHAEVASHEIVLRLRAE